MCGSSIKDARDRSIGRKNSLLILIGEKPWAECNKDWTISMVLFRNFATRSERIGENATLWLKTAQGKMSILAVMRLHKGQLHVSIARCNGH